MKVKPGSALNEMVAEKVLGWTKLPSCQQLHPPGTKEAHGNSSCSYGTMPSWSTKLGDAAQVHDSFFGTHKLALYLGFLEAFGIYTRSEEAAYHICVAALLAVGEDVSRELE